MLPNGAPDLSVAVPPEAPPTCPFAIDDISQLSMCESFKLLFVLVATVPANLNLVQFKI